MAPTGDVRDNQKRERMGLAEYRSPNMRSSVRTGRTSRHIQPPGASRGVTIGYSIGIGRKIIMHSASHVTAPRIRRHEERSCIVSTDIRLQQVSSCLLIISLYTCLLRRSQHHVAKLSRRPKLQCAGGGTPGDRLSLPSQRTVSCIRSTFHKILPRFTACRNAISACRITWRLETVVDPCSAWTFHSNHRWPCWWFHRSGNTERTGTLRSVSSAITKPFEWQLIGNNTATESPSRHHRHHRGSGDWLQLSHSSGPASTSQYYCLLEEELHNRV